MLTKSNNIICDDCGRFVSIESVMSGAAKHHYALPDSEFSKETFESKCPRCVKKEREVHAHV